MNRHAIVATALNRWFAATAGTSEARTLARRLVRLRNRGFMFRLPQCSERMLAQDAGVEP